MMRALRYSAAVLAAAACSAAWAQATDVAWPRERKTDDGTTITIRVGTPLEEVERRVTMATLVYCGHVKRKAAEILGVSLKTLYNRLEAYNGKDSAGAAKDVGMDPADTAEMARESARG